MRTNRNRRRAESSGLKKTLLVLAGAIVLAAAVFAVFLTQRHLPARGETTAGTAEKTTAGEVTNTTAAATTRAVKPPAVVTYYQLKESGNGNSITFDVELPKIVSEKPGAVKVNGAVDKLRAMIESVKNQKDKTYSIDYKMAYETHTYKNMLFLRVGYITAPRASEYIEAVYYFTYDYANDKMLSNNDLAGMYGQTLKDITDKVNRILTENGYYSLSAENPLYLYADKQGKLAACAGTRTIESDFSALVVIDNTSGGTWKIKDNFKSIVNGDSEYTVITKGAPLNLRAGPGQDYMVITTIPNQAEVLVCVAIEEGWAYVVYGNYRGWVSNEFIEPAS